LKPIAVPLQRDVERVHSRIHFTAERGLMKEYDVIVIGSGAGANLIEDALAHNKTVALVDKGPAGGTCLNVG
jgi:hypothetical protein